MAYKQCSCYFLQPMPSDGVAPARLAGFRQARQSLPQFQPNSWEVFSGQNNLHRACPTAGLDAVGFEHVSDTAECPRHSKGLSAAIRRVLNVKPHGLVRFAPPCSSWTSLSSDSHARRQDNQKAGHGSNINVSLALLDSSSTLTSKESA